MNAAHVLDPEAVRHDASIPDDDNDGDDRIKIKSNAGGLKFMECAFEDVAVDTVLLTLLFIILKCKKVHMLEAFILRSLTPF